MEIELINCYYDDRHYGFKLNKIINLKNSLDTNLKDTVQLVKRVKDRRVIFLHGRPIVSVFSNNHSFPEM